MADTNPECYPLFSRPDSRYWQRQRQSDPLLVLNTGPQPFFLFPPETSNAVRQRYRQLELARRNVNITPQLDGPAPQQQTYIFPLECLNVRAFSPWNRFSTQDTVKQLGGSPPQQTYVFPLQDPNWRRYYVANVTRYAEVNRYTSQVSPAVLVLTTTGRPGRAITTVERVRDAETKPDIPS